METTWEKFFDEVMPELPGAPAAALVKNAIRNAGIEFCDRTWVYRVEHDPLAAEANVPDYELETPTKTALVKVHRAWYEKKEIWPKSPQELATIFAHWPSQVGTPLYFTQRSPGVILLVPMPSASLQDAITAEMAIKPTRASTGISTDLYEKYLEEIAYGAKARLFAMKAKPWSDAKLAAFNLGMFDQAIGRAKVQAAKGHTRARLRVKPHFY
jgi:hypothetical protein